jgi:hypothetical protein
VTTAMKDEIERALAPLVGLPLWGAGRESNMLSLQLGERRPSPTRADPGREVGGYTLHVYCAWRLARGAALLAGSGDLFTPADPDEELETFDHDAPGATWWDARVAAYLGAATGDGRPAPTVTAVGADALGGVRVALSDGAALEVFPNSSAAERFETEFWRLRRPGSDEDDVVVGTFGLERQFRG